MRIATWNINGLRARLEFVLAWLGERQPDVVGLQELKLADENFPADAFEAAGRHLSFTRAAGELNVTQAAVSHQVKALEAELDRVLFQRNPRGVDLTEAGAVLLVALIIRYLVIYLR